MSARRNGNRRLAALMLAAVGVVYGDIGTSPLYALRECFHGPHGVAPTPDNILGVLSLILWSLILVISVKYLLLIMRADNRGEGGILALLALVCPPGDAVEGRSRRRVLLVLMGLFGAALLYGDGMITPAISVLSAVEGLEVATPKLSGAVVPITVAILTGLFLFQSRGTQRVGVVFGPVTLVWFGLLAVLGVGPILQHPEVLAAASPHHAVAFFRDHGQGGLVVLGAVFLVVTGGEALYADMGHFGRLPIRATWFAVVLPSLMLNYFGQGALLLASPAHAVNPFYHLAPGWALYPLVVLAGAATVVASQAVITGAFSLTWQAVQLGYLPRVEVRHTSEEEIGQIYIPLVNWGLYLATVLLVLGFGTSSRLAAAYGIAVSTTMVITTILAYVAMRRLWAWKVAAALAVAGFFLVFDLAFLGANALKIADGGWFPLLVATLILVVMTTWRRGRRILTERIAETAVPLDELTEKVAAAGPRRVPGTAVYLTSDVGSVPPALLRLLQHLGSLHERVVFFTVMPARQPTVAAEDRLVVEELDDGFWRVVAHYGFVEQPNVPRALVECRKRGLDIDFDELAYVLGRETILATDRPGMALWREKLFGLLSRNAGRATAFFRLPPRKVLEVGSQIEL